MSSGSGVSDARRQSCYVLDKRMSKDRLAPQVKKDYQCVQYSAPRGGIELGSLTKYHRPVRPGYSNACVPGNLRSGPMSTMHLRNSPTSTDVHRPRSPRSPILGNTPPFVLVNGPDSCIIRTVGANRLSIRVVTVWHQTKAKFNRLLGNAPPQVYAARAPTHPLPYEIRKMIVAHLIHDLRSLKACSLTCRSWYIVTVPHPYSREGHRSQWAETATQAARAWSDTPRARN